MSFMDYLHGFHNGDTVMFTGRSDPCGNGPRFGDIGTVIAANSESAAVAFDIERYGMHRCSGLIPNNCGWYVYFRDLRPAERVSDLGDFELKECNLNELF